MKRKLGAVLLVALALSLGLMPAASVEASSGPGIVGLWHLDERTGATAGDSSGNGNDGALEGGFGTALSFDGNDYVEIASNSSIMPATLTVEAWIQPGKTGARQSIVSKWDGGGDASYSLELTPTNKFLFYLHNGTTTQSITGTTVITVGEWYHVAGTYDGLQARLYVNGVLEAGPTTLVVPMTTSGVPLRIGASAKKAPYPIYVPFKGAIDEVRLSNLARTSFNLTAPPSADTNTVGLWRFNEGSGQTAGDSAGSNHGQLGSTSAPDVNDPTWVTSGVPAGPQWVADQWGGKALDFDGVDDYVDCGNVTQLDGLSAFTVEFWIKVDSLPFPADKWEGIIARGSSPQRCPWVFGNKGSSNLYMQFETTTGSAADCSLTTNNLTAGQWHHVAFTWDGTTVTSYLDGLAGPTDTTSGSVLVNTDGSLKFGHIPGYAYFDGLIDEVRIWDTVTPTFNFDADPNVDFNPVDTDHTITATVSIDRTDDGKEVAPGVKVDFDITDPNTSESDTKYTQNDGVATLTCTSDGIAGAESIDVSIDWDWCVPAAETVEKYWLENFVTGGGKINGNGKKAALTFAGTVGVLEDLGIVGQFQVVDHTGKGSEAWHCNNNFTYLNFSGPSTTSPPASHNTAEFTGTFTSNRGSPPVTVTITIHDLGEPGAGVDTITFDGITLTIDGGNFQVHDYPSD